MTLLDRILARGWELPPDPIIAARIERHVRRIQPDPLFRKRLRSVVVNRYVAAREGMAVPALPRARRQMGMLGRGVLYASLVTALGVTAVGAASQPSLPGDALYGVKLSIEELRMQVAPPGLLDDLAALALDERLDEVERLASAGRWELVGEAADRAAAAETRLEALAPSAAALELLTGEHSVAVHAQRLAALMATAPASALDGLRRALAASTLPHAPNGGGAAGGNGGQADSPDGGTNQGPQSGSTAQHGPGSGGQPGSGDTSGSSGGQAGSGSTDNDAQDGSGTGGQAAQPTSSPAQPPDGNDPGDGGGRGDNAGGNQQ